MRKLTKKQVIPFIVIIGVVIIPLLYSFFYLDAFWDPYAKLNTLPVAVVNEDQGAQLNGQQRNFGNEMCDELKNSGELKFVFTTVEDAKKGTENSDYYAYLKIPSNFSEVIASASTDSNQVAQLVYSPNEKRNYLACQILNRAVLQIEGSLKNKINSEIISELTSQLSQTPDKLKPLSDGLTKLNDGTTKLSDGTGALVTGSDDLSKGAKTLDGGINQLLSGINKIDSKTANINDLNTGAAQLSAAAKEFNTALTKYTTGVTALINNANSTSQFIGAFVQKNPGVLNDKTFAAFVGQMGSAQNKAAIQQLSAATSKLTAASSQISAGIEKLSQGTKSIPQLKEGLAQIKAGLEDANTGSAALSQGAQKLNSGIKEVNGGAVQLHDGTQQALSGVNQSIIDGNGQVSSIDKLQDFTSDRVKFNQESLYPVPNYGTAFAPYFLSLSMWVGALIIFFAIYLDADGKFKLLSRESTNKVARSFCYLAIALVQAIILGLVLIFALGLEVKNVPLYFATCCLVSLAFISIVQFLMVFLKDIGKFLTIALLILQLTSCGGTFPMQTVPKIFNVLYPFMPMTYSVTLLKESISGVQSSYATQSMITLIAIFVVFMTVTVLLSLARKKRAERA